MGMKPLLEKLLKVNLSAGRARATGVGAMSLAHHKEFLRALWWYNILDGRLEYSADTFTHQDRRVFKGPFTDDKGWVRGRVFQYRGKYYIVAYLEDWLDHAVTNESMADLYSQIQDKFKHTISNVVDEEGYSLTENKRRR